MLISRRQFAKEAGALALGGTIGGTMLKQLLATQCEGPAGKYSCGGGGGGGNGGGGRNGPYYDPGQTYVDSYGGELGVINSNSNICIQSSLATAWTTYQQSGVTESFCNDLASAWSQIYNSYVGSHVASYASQIVSGSTPSAAQQNYLITPTEAVLQSYQSHANAYGCGVDYTTVSSAAGLVNMGAWPLEPAGQAILNSTWQGTLSGGYSLFTSIGNTVGLHGQLSAGTCGELGTLAEAAAYLSGIYAGIAFFFPVTAPVLDPASAVLIITAGISYFAHKELC